MNVLRAALLALALAAGGSGCLAPQPPPAFPGTASARADAPPPSAAYTDGYRAGVVAHLDGAAAPPAPPVYYRLANYWDTANPAAEDWTAGFRTGAAAARASGLRGPAERPAAVARLRGGEPVPAGRTRTDDAPHTAVAQRPAPVIPPPNEAGFRPLPRPEVLPAQFTPVGTPPVTADAKVAAPPKAPAAVEVTVPVVKPAVARIPVVTVERPEAATRPPNLPAAGAPEFGPWRPAQLPPPTVVRDP